MGGLLETHQPLFEHLGALAFHNHIPDQIFM